MTPYISVPMFSSTVLLLPAFHGTRLDMPGLRGSPLAWRMILAPLEEQGDEKDPCITQTELHGYPLSRVFFVLCAFFALAESTDGEQTAAARPDGVRKAGRGRAGRASADSARYPDRERAGERQIQTYITCDSSPAGLGGPPHHKLVSPARVTGPPHDKLVSPGCSNSATIGSPAWCSSTYSFSPTNAGRAEGRYLVSPCDHVAMQRSFIMCIFRPEIRS